MARQPEGPVVPTNEVSESALEAFIAATKKPVDVRRMFFTHGEPHIFSKDGDPDVIVTEHINGVLLEHRFSTRTVQRTWPDGTVEHYDFDDPRDREVPYLPRGQSGPCPS